MIGQLARKDPGRLYLIISSGAARRDQKGCVMCSDSGQCVDVWMRAWITVYDSPRNADPL